MSRIVTTPLRDVSFQAMNVAFLNYSLGSLHPSAYFLSASDYKEYSAILWAYAENHRIVKNELETRGYLMMNGRPVIEDADLPNGTVGLLICDELYDSIGRKDADA